MLLTVLTVSFLVTLFMGFPIALVLGVSSCAYILVAGLPLTIIPQKMFSGMDSFVMLAIPAFILAGNLMNGGGITERIVRFATAVVGHIRGGLGHTNIFASMVFAGISGTAAADAASIGAVMIPGMTKAGYPKQYAAALTAAASCMGPIIPPSVPMIVVGSICGISVGQMFAAGAVPGVLLAVGMMTVNGYLSTKRGYPREPWMGFRELWKSFQGAVWALIMTAMILFGILSGWFTPTEAAVVSVLYAFVIGIYVYKGFTLSDVPRLIADSAIAGAGLLILVGFANVFGWILTSERIPQYISAWMLAVTDNKYVFILLVNILLLIVGCFMETIAALIILTPPLLAVAITLGVDPVHFATFTILNLIIGLTTPPVGVCLFICANIAKVSLVEISVAIWPFLFTNLVVLFLVSYVPWVSLLLPTIFFR